MGISEGVRMVTGGVEGYPYKVVSTEPIVKKVTANDLKALGFEPKEMRDAGVKASELKDAGFTVKDMKEGHFSAAELKNAGCDVKTLQEAGFTVDMLKKAGYPEDELCGL